MCHHSIHVRGPSARCQCEDGYVLCVWRSRRRHHKRRNPSKPAARRSWPEIVSRRRQRKNEHCQWVGTRVVLILNFSLGPGGSLNHNCHVPPNTEIYCGHLIVLVDALFRELTEFAQLESTVANGPIRLGK
jgi:hypothetical protein